jgi:hypothetical protein
MGDYSINNIVSALRGGASDEEKQAMAEKESAKKLLDLKAEQASIDEFNARARAMGFSTRPDVIVNGVPVEKAAPAAVQEAAAPISDDDDIGGDVKSAFNQKLCEHEWANQADSDEGRKAEFMTACMAQKNGTGYSL